MLSLKTVMDGKRLLGKNLFIGYSTVLWKLITNWLLFPSPAQRHPGFPTVRPGLPYFQGTVVVRKQTSLYVLGVHSNIQTGVIFAGSLGSATLVKGRSFKGRGWMVVKKSIIHTHLR